MFQKISIIEIFVATSVTGEKVVIEKWEKRSGDRFVSDGQIHYAKNAIKFYQIENEDDVILLNDGLSYRRVEDGEIFIKDV